MQARDVWDYTIFSANVSETQNSIKLYLGEQKQHILSYLPLMAMEEGGGNFIWSFLHLSIMSSSANIVLL